MRSDCREPNAALAGNPFHVSYRDFTEFTVKQDKLGKLETGATKISTSLLNEWRAPRLGLVEHLYVERLLQWCCLP